MNGPDLFKRLRRLSVSILFTLSMLLLLVGILQTNLMMPVNAASISKSAITPATTFDVDSMDDAPDASPGDGLCATSTGECTLRAALDEASAAPSLDTVNVPAGTYLVIGEALVIADTEVIIDGDPGGGTFLDGTDATSGILFAQHGSDVTATHLHFQNGQGGCYPVYGCAMGGAITNDGVMHLSDSSVRDSHGGTNGGGILNNHHLTLEDCVVENNRAQQVGGGINSSGYDYPSSLTVRDTLVYGNMTGGAGAGIHVEESEVLLERVTVQYNAAFGTPSANAYGGGMAIKGGSEPVTVTITDSVFADNYSSASGGAIFASNDLQVFNSEFRYNRAAQLGGAFFTQAPVTIEGSNIFGNSAGYDGGGVCPNTDDLTITRTAILSNTARDGGGLYLRFASDHQLENVTITGNQARRLGGAIYTRKSMDIAYSTLANNSADEGGDVFATEGGLDVTLASSVIADTGGDACQVESGDLVSAGYNVFQDTSGCSLTGTTGDQFGTDPLLDILQDNGGSIRTLTHALLPGSPAIDGGEAVICPTTDQRGLSRPMDGGCDSGAFESGHAVSPVPWDPPPPLPEYVYATYPTPVPGITLIVNIDETGHTSGDTNPGDGICDNGYLVGPDPECTLRAALEEANAYLGQDTIILPAGVHTRGSYSQDITDHLIIAGAGRDSTIIDAPGGGRGLPQIDYSTIVNISDVTLQGGTHFINVNGKLTLEDCLVQNASDSAIHVYYSYDDTMPVDDPLPELTVQRCIFRDNQGAFNGGAILSYGKNLIEDSIFENNQADSGGGAILTSGGAGVNEKGNITIINSTFDGNVAGSYGGAVYNKWGLVNVDNSIFTNNSVTEPSSSSQGGAIQGQSWITITDSYFGNNYAYYTGGAVVNGGEWNLDVDPAIVTVSGSAFVDNESDLGGGVTFSGIGSVDNSTFSGNRALRDGGGLLIAADSLGTLTNVTMMHNVADSDDNGSGEGGGMKLSGGLYDNPGDFTMQNSVLAGNTAVAGPDCLSETGYGLSLGTNIIGDISDCGIVTTGDDLFGSSGSPYDPVLLALTPVQNHNAVHVPLETSPARDTGNCTGLDQRGIARPVCDRGAAEWTPPYTFVVNNTGTDEDRELGDGICATDSDDCSFRAALEEANVFAFNDTVSLPPGGYQSPELQIWWSDVEIAGAGAMQTALTGRGTSRVLVTGLETEPDQQIHIQDLAIEDGDAPSSNRGGGILNYADLTLERVLVQNNEADNGGGLANEGDGQLTVLNSAFVGNTGRYGIAPNYRGKGGGIYNSSNEPVEITNATISGNLAGQDGGGVFHSGSDFMKLINVTVADNEAETGIAGGVYNDGVNFSLTNTIVGDNHDHERSPDCYGYFYGGDSLVEVQTSDCDFSIPPLSGDPMLDPLADNGGNTLTHELQGGSPAINTGNDTYAPPTDQRGYYRWHQLEIESYEFRGAAGAATPVVFISLDGEDPLLSWQHLTVNTGYQVWRDTVPSVTPNVGGAQLLTTVTTEPWEYLDTHAAVGNYYYTLVGENGASESDPSNRVGVFRFDLTPGH